MKAKPYPGGRDEPTAPSSTFQFKTTPFEHQREFFEKTRELKTHAVLWEQGTGKTKLVIDTAASLALGGKIDAMLVLAPQGVHTNWVTVELPDHWPDAAPKPTMWIYQTERSITKWHDRGSKKMATSEYAFPILAMTYAAIMTKKGAKLAADFLRRRKVFYILDESARIKTPSAKRTKRVVASGAHAEYKRIMTGTAITNSPFDLWTQLRFLDPDFWQKNGGFESLESFKGTFGEFEPITRSFYNKASGKWEAREVPNLKYFKNLEYLHELIKGSSSRVLKADVLDLPPKLYTKRFFEMSSQQRRLYKELETECMTFLDSGELVSAPLAITRLLRFQQILCGYLPDDEGRIIHDLDENPLMKLFIDTLEDVDGQAIIWARFQRDIDLILAELDKRAKKLKDPKERGVRYDGRVAHAQREKNLLEFRSGDARFFVANPAVGGTGLTLNEASTVLYYSNSFDLEHRCQSEDRPHRIGQDKPVLYYDFSCHGTVLEHIIRALRKKHNFAAVINGDVLKKWI